MKVDTQKLPEHITKFLNLEGYSRLYPPQQRSIESGILRGENVLVSAPTASGKTLIAMIAIIDYLTKNSGKIVYLSPLKALASEKFNELQKIGKILDRKIRIELATGDFDSQDKALEKSDILVLTNEKMDSILRQDAEWIEQIGLVIADEVHLIGDEDRGPVLEMVLSRLRLLENKPQIIGLSATISNAVEIARWLGANLVEEEWRPVPLFEGVYDGGRVVMNNGNNFEVESTLRGPSIDLGIESVKAGGQSLVFAETRTRAVSLATKASEPISKLLKEADSKHLEKISKDILAKNEHTELVKILSELVRRGVAFHHAGLTQWCRETIENEFRSGRIKLLTSTPTLAAGVNLPARRVIISSIKRYNARVGTNMPISVLEYKQLCGRAGRPQYDEYGEAIIVGSSNTEDLIDCYVKGSPEPIESKIISDKSLRIHVLSLIKTNPGIKEKEIIEFFLQTLGGMQTSRATIRFGVKMALRFLSSEDFIINKGDRYITSEFGKKVSMLYIDPLTATHFKNGIKKVSKKEGHTLGFLHLISNCEEFYPKFSMRDKDYQTASTLIENHASELIEPISEYDCNRSLLALYFWINEFTEISLADNLRIESGDMHRMVETTDWLIYCLRELSKQQERADLLNELDVLRNRVRYGIKEELIDLIKVKGIGRVRARSLYKHGIKNREELAKISVKKLAEIDKIGSTLADNIKSQLRKDR